MKEHENSIYIKGARVHNLRNIEVEIPHNKLVVVTGLSGSGKSTLAFDTIFAEGQRRYVESLSAYARQFLGKINKPDVDIITGIAPAIAIEQKVNTRNPRSTVGTTTEIFDYLKLLFARAGHTFSPVSGQEVRCFSVDDVAARILARDGQRVVIGAPLVLGEGQGIIEKLTLLLSEGLMRVYTGGEVRLIEDVLPGIGPDTRADEIRIVVDRMRVATDEDSQTRIRDSVARAFSYGGGICEIVTDEGVREFSSRFEADGIEFERPSEHLFSFNNPLGACPRCEGYGKVIGIDEDLVIPGKSKTIYTHEDAVACWRGETMRKWKQQLVENASKFGFPIHTPFHELTPEQKRLLWRGNEYFHGLDEFFEYIDSERRKIQFRVMKARYTGKTACPECGGSRLRKEALYVRVGGKTIADLVAMPVDSLIAFFAGLELDEHDTKTASRILVEIRNRLQYLADVGLGYLTLDRLSSTLSGGESQRINLSTSLGSNLTGSLYILDEPSIGLHPRDTNRLIGVLKQLRDLGNTVIVVEHEEEVIRAADWIVDIGPKAGYNGGEVVFSGTLLQLLKSKKSLTADYLTGRREIAVPATARGWSNSITVKGARENNLLNVDVRIPLGVMTITGVSGSGKSSLAKESSTTAALLRHGRETRRFRRPDGRRAAAQIGRDGRPEPHRQVVAFESRDLHQGLRRNPETLFGPALCPAQRAGRFGLLVQHRRRPLRGVPGRGHDQGLDAVHGRRGTGLRGVRRAAFPRRGARSEIPRQVDLRRTGNDRGRRHRLLRRGKQEERHLPAHRRAAATVAGRGSGIHQVRTVVVDPLGRREPAREAGFVPDEGFGAGRRHVHLRRADDGAALPRHLETARGVQRPDPARTHDRRRRAQHGHHQMRRLDRGPRPRGGHGGRTGRVRKHAARTGKVHRKPYRQIFAHARKK